MIGKMQMNPGLREAMQLMQSGNLAAATQAIQRGLAAGADERPPEAAHEPAHADVAEHDTRSRPAQGDDGARFVSGVHASPAGERRYKLFIPAGAPEGPRPLVVMLHGCTQTPHDFATGTRMNALGAQHGCYVLYPEQPRSANHSRCWNWFNAADQRRDAGEPAILASLVREIARQHPIDASRIYVAGLSAGGAMAVILGRTHPELFAAVGVHSGLPFGAAHDLPSALAAMRGGPGSRISQPQRCMPTIVFHGDRDTTVHPANGEQVALEATGPCACEVDHVDAAHDDGKRSVTRKLFRDEAGTVMVESWLVHGAAHQWSGGDPSGTHTDAAGPDASREMLRFFLARTATVTQPA